MSVAQEVISELFLNEKVKIQKKTGEIVKGVLRAIDKDVMAIERQHDSMFFINIEEYEFIGNYNESEG